MSESASSQCWSCGSDPAVPEARFCHECGVILRPADRVFDDRPVEPGEPAEIVGRRRWVRLGSNLPSLDSQLHGAEPNEWDPGVWEQRGYERRFGDAWVGSPYFEVLRKEREGPQGYETSFVVLCPTFLRRPLSFYLWGSGSASY